MSTKLVNHSQFNKFKIFPHTVFPILPYSYSVDSFILLYNREFNLVVFPDHKIISPETDFLVYSADGPRKTNFDTSVLYKGTLEYKEVHIANN